MKSIRSSARHSMLTEIHNHKRHRLPPLRPAHLRAEPKERHLLQQLRVPKSNALFFCAGYCTQGSTQCQCTAFQLVSFDFVDSVLFTSLSFTFHLLASTHVIRKQPNSLCVYVFPLFSCATISHATTITAEVILRLCPPSRV